MFWYIYYLYQRRLCFKALVCVFVCCLLYCINPTLHWSKPVIALTLDVIKMKPHLSVFCFLWFTNCVLLSDTDLIPGCLWLLAFVLNNTLILGIWCSTIPHLPGCFCPWTFFQNIGFNMVPSDPFMSHQATQLGYICMGVSGFATDSPCGVWCRGLTTCLLHVVPPFGNRLLNNSWAVGLTKWIIYLQSFVFWHMQYSCANIFHRRSLYTFNREFIAVMSFYLSPVRWFCHFSVNMGVIVDFINLVCMGVIVKFKFHVIIL